MAIGGLPSTLGLVTVWRPFCAILPAMTQIPEQSIHTDPEQSPVTERLSSIPVVETGPNFALETLNSHLDHAHQLLDQATARIPAPILSQLDRVSRAWLQRWENMHLAEIDAVARQLNRPGAYFFSVNYEWGCTCRVAPAPDGRSARLARVLDWKTPGLGRNIIAANVRGGVGRFTTLTWPGYTGVLSAIAPGRFSAALNQAPMRKTSGYFVLDWAANRHRVWNMPHPTPTHLLRRVFETAPDFRTAKDLLTHQPISTPAIFLLAGLAGCETVIIERKEREAHVIDGAAVAANHWQAPGWRGHARGRNSAGRAALMEAIAIDLNRDFSWLRPPILNDRTRLVMIADASQAALKAQGFEATKPATKLLDLQLG